MDKILIYQVLPRLYGNACTQNVPSGTIEQNGCGKMNDFTDARLRRIATYGFTHIWYTGLLEHATQTDYTAHGIAADNPMVVKGKAGSPYAIKDYYDIDPDLASTPSKRMREFQALVNRTHKAGLKMVLDFVPNHVARQYHSDAAPAGVRDLGADDDQTKAFSPQNNFYYVPGETLHTHFAQGKNFSTPYEETPAKATGNDRFDAWPQVNDWYETVKLNYGVDYLNGRSEHFDPVPDTWNKMTDILLFWAAKGIDAFRCDMAEMVPAAFWTYAIKRVKHQYPEILFIAEVYNPNAYRAYIASGFDYLYDKVGLYDTLRAIVCCQASASAITGAWQSVDGLQDHMLHFLENHDEQRIASPQFAGDARKAMPAAAVSVLMDKSPFMLYAGQEVGEPAVEAEGFSGQDGRTTIFDYWGVRSLQALCARSVEKALTPEQRSLYEDYHRLLLLCRDHKAITQGDFYDLQYANYDHSNGYDCDRHYAFLRKGGGETLLVVANFNPSRVRVGVRIPAHAFEHLKLRSGMYSGYDCLTGEISTLDFMPDRPAFVEVPGYGVAVVKVY